jgi:hypothetical protein
VRDYGVIVPRFWIAGTGKSLRGDKDAQILATYLPTSPHAIATGVYHCPVLYMAHETGLTLEEASKALRRLIDEGFCDYDEPSETVFVIKMAEHQIGETVNQKDKRYIWLKKELEKMPKAFKTRFLAIYGVAFSLVDKPEPGSPSEAPSKPLRSQDQDQDQDQDQEQDQEQEALRAPSAAPTALADKQPKPEGEMAIALRNLGVVVRSIDPVLIAWVKDGFTTQQAVDAVGIARIRKPHPEAIPANYLDKILRQPARPPPQAVKAVDRITWRPPPDDDPPCTPPNSTPSSKH